MNGSVDPCEDFYNFACGGWINKHPIPQSQSFWDQLSLLREKLLQNLRILLEEPDKETDLKPVKLARALYKTCMDIGKSEELKSNDLVKYLEEKNFKKFARKFFNYEYY